MQDFYILDTTLRDGEQTAGVAFSRNDKVRIAQKLAEAGVDVIEAGIPVMGSEEQETLSEILKLDLKAKVISWNRIKMKDIKESVSCGFDNVHISVPVSDLHIEKKLSKDRKWVLKELEQVVYYARSLGCSVSVGAEDASRADQTFLLKVFQLAQSLGAKRVRYADTVGGLDPFTTYRKIEFIRKNSDLDIDFHGHNDLGMATANAFSAYSAGAAYISCTVNGLGERAGNTPLEEIVMALIHLKDCRTNFDIKKIPSLSRIIEEASRRPVSDGKPIVGKGVFTHESGIHVDGLIKDSRTYEIFSPEELGRKRNFILGKFSGTRAIIHKYHHEGREISREEASHILKNLRSYI